MVNNKTNVSISKKFLILILLIGLALFQVSNGRWIVPIATWLYPIFLIFFLRNYKSVWLTIICYLAFFGIFSIQWRSLIPAPDPMYFMITGGVSLIFFIPFLLDKFFSKRISGFLSTLIFPLSYVAIEYIVSLVNPYGTWTFLAYTQYGNLPLMQIVNITGIFGITFILTWLGSAVNWAWEEKFAWDAIRKGVMIYTSVFLGIILYGGISLVVLAPKSVEVKVAGIQSNLPQELAEKYKAEYEALKEDGVYISKAQWDYTIKMEQAAIDDLFYKTELEARSGAKIISWAEATAKVYKDDVPAFLERAQNVAKNENIYLMVEYTSIFNTDMKLLPETKLLENTATFISPEGEILYTYVKGIPTPGNEALWSDEGDGKLKYAETPYGKVTTIICFENGFPAYNRQAGLENVDLVFDPAGDWEAIDPYHTYMHSFRAVENGYSMLRVTSLGLSAAYDYQGRQLSTMDFFKTDSKVFTAFLPTEGVTTVYSRIGDAFAVLCSLGFIALVVLAVRKKNTKEAV